MKLLPYSILFLMACVFTTSCEEPSSKSEILQHDNILSVEVDTEEDKIAFYWKNKDGELFGSIQNLKSEFESKSKKLRFAMNGGMYDKFQNPQGLFIENGILKQELDRREDGYGNFYLQPNGVLIINKDNSAEITTTDDLDSMISIKYATQSGPMLIVDGIINDKLKEGCKNLHIRNGVGLLPNGHLLFALSKTKINFYDFAAHFKVNGCKNALYLDGFVSRAYNPEQNWAQLDGSFGVIIGIEE